MMPRSPTRPLRRAQADAAAQLEADTEVDISSNIGDNIGDESSVIVSDEPSAQLNSSTSNILERARALAAQREATAAAARRDRAQRRSAQQSALTKYLDASSEQRANMAAQLADQQDEQQVDELNGKQTLYHQSTEGEDGNSGNQYEQQLAGTEHITSRQHKNDEDVGSEGLQRLVVNTPEQVAPGLHHQHALPVRGTTTTSTRSQHEVVDMAQQMARASLQLLQEERQAMYDQNRSSLTSAFQTAITAIRDGTGTSTAMNGSGGIGNIYRPELKSVSTLMRDRVFRGEPSSLRAFKKQWDSVTESWTSFKPGCVIPDDYRNVLI
jgi:hypothetical protein